MYQTILGLLGWIGKMPLNFWHYLVELRDCCSHIPAPSITVPRCKASLIVSGIGAVDEPTSELHFKETGLYCFAHRPMFSLCNTPLYWFPRMKASGYSGDLKPLCKTGKITVFWDVRPRSLVIIYRRFGGACCLRLQGTWAVLWKPQIMHGIILNILYCY
jgi:hypothetical protein